MIRFNPFIYLFIYCTFCFASINIRGNRPDLISRVFKMKYDELMQDITKKKVNIKRPFKNYATIYFSTNFLSNLAI